MANSFPTSNPGVPTQRGTAALYTELRIHTLLLLQMVTLLSQILGTSTSGTTPIDMTADVDVWRTDPSLQGG